MRVNVGKWDVEFIWGEVSDFVECVNSTCTTYKSFAIMLKSDFSVGCDSMHYDGLPMGSLRLGWLWFSLGVFTRWGGRE